MTNIILAEAALQNAYSKAAVRAAYSYFDQHVIQTDDGRCWAVDEGDYETVLADMADRIVATIRAGRLDA